MNRSNHHICILQWKHIFNIMVCSIDFDQCAVFKPSIIEYDIYANIAYRNVQAWHKHSLTEL